MEVVFDRKERRKILDLINANFKQLVEEVATLKNELKTTKPSDRIQVTRKLFETLKEQDIVREISRKLKGRLGARHTTNHHHVKATENHDQTSDSRNQRGHTEDSR